MNFDLHAPTILVISAALGFILAGACFTFRKAGRLGAATARLGIGNLILAVGCLARVHAIETHHPFIFGSAYALLSAGLLVHLSALRKMADLHSIDGWLIVMSATHCSVMAALSSFPLRESYFALATNVMTLSTAALSIASASHLKGKVFKAVRSALFIAFIGMGSMALLQASSRLSLFDEVGASNAVSGSLFGLTMFVVAINLTYLALYMTLQRHQIARMANLDPLTDVLNRRGLEMFLSQLLQGSKISLTGSVLLMDVDRFKSINDNLGHASGDYVLNSIGKVLKANMRNTDAVGRVGGEEFALILPNLGASGAEVIAERLRLELSDLKICTPDYDNVSITVSIGVAEFDIDKPVLDQLLQRSDVALYTAKANGRNRTEVWSPKLELLMHTLRFQKPASNGLVPQASLA